VRGYSTRGGGAYPKWWCTGNCLYLLHLLPTFPERARDLTGAYRELMKRVDANRVLAHAFTALEELALNLTGNNESPRSSLLRRSSHFGYEGRKLRGIRQEE